MTSVTSETTPPGTATEIAKRQQLAICSDADSFYASLDPAIAAKARERAGYIREKQKIAANNFIEIGKALILTKSELGHGNFLKWIEREFAMSEQSARAYMQCAAFVLKRPDAIVPDLPMRVMLLLASKTTPESARTEILDLTAAGERVTVGAAKAIIVEHKPKIEAPAPEPQPEAKPERVSASEGRKLVEAARKSGESISGPAPTPAKAKPAKSSAAMTKPETKKERKARERAEKADQRKREEAKSDALALEVYSWIYESMPADLKSRIEEMKKIDEKKMSSDFRGGFLPFSFFLGELETLLQYFVHPDELDEDEDDADTSADRDETEATIESSADEAQAEAEAEADHGLTDLDLPSDPTPPRLIDLDAYDPDAEDAFARIKNTAHEIGGGTSHDAEVDRFMHDLDEIG